jgi:pimeloyl-ACP methyl ester carboxylesterase
MAVVLLHGNPETPVIWDALRAELGRDDVFTPQLPGFGCEVRPGFGATKEEYAMWLVAELEPIVDEHGPVDFVGHDWGGAMGMRAITIRPHLFRTWACDVLGLFHPDYVWHDFAQIWQTPGAGEQYFEQSLAASVDERVALFEAIGIPRATGEQLAAAGDETMGKCVLALYRSATQPAMKEWGEHLGPAATIPGLAIIAPNDPFVQSDTLGAEVADRIGATKHVLDGQGHWWMLGDPAAGATMLSDFWAEAYRGAE